MIVRVKVQNTTRIKTYHNKHKRRTKKSAGYSHRTATTAYPCCIPALGRFSRSWSCKTCRLQM